MLRTYNQFDTYGDRPDEYNPERRYDICHRQLGLYARSLAEQNRQIEHLIADNKTKGDLIERQTKHIDDLIGDRGRLLILMSDKCSNEEQGNILDLMKG